VVVAAMGEYVAGTTLFIPLEIYEVTEMGSWLKITVLLINIAAMPYLLLSTRLFGLRGGHRADEESLHEVSRPRSRSPRTPTLEPPIGQPAAP
jgi:Predicted membrane protein (DUF2127)